jgi:TP901 family phage tail tape measure protein
MASERRLSAIITIGGAVASSLGSAFRSAESGVNTLNARIRQNTQRQREISEQTRIQQRATTTASRLSAEERSRVGSLIRVQNALNTARGLENRLITRTPTTRREAISAETRVLRQQREEIRSMMATATNPLSQSLMGAEVERLNNRMQSLRTTLQQVRTEERGQTDEIRRMVAEQDRLRASSERLQALDQRRTRALQQHSEIIGKMGRIVAVGAAMAVPVGMAFKKASEFDYQNTMIGNTADMTRPETKEMGMATLMASRKTGQSAEDTQKGLGFLVQAGMDVKTAQESIVTIGRTATAAGAEIEDLAKASYTLNDALKISPKDLQASLDTLAVAGKEGNVELKDIAKVIPTIGAGMVGLKMKGRDAVATMGAMLEIARKGAPTADEAANNMANFMQKVASPTTIKKGEKEFGIRLDKVIEKAQKEGKDPLEESLKVISKVTNGGENVKLGKLFQDVQVQNFVRPMLQNYAEYERIKKKALQAMGVTDKDYERVAETSKQKTAELTNELGLLSIVVGQAVTPAITNLMTAVTPVIAGITDWVIKNPELTSQIVMVGGALVGAKLGFLGLKLAINGMGLMHHRHDCSVDRGNGDNWNCCTSRISGFHGFRECFRSGHTLNY